MDFGNFTSIGLNMTVDLFDKFREALETISWKKEPWLVALMVFHITIPLVYIRLRKHATFLSVTLFLLLGAIFASPWLNELGAQYWRNFATEQYFDSYGYFILCAWSLPLLSHAILLMFLLLIRVANLLIQKKRLELRRAPAESKKTQ